MLTPCEACIESVNSILLEHELDIRVTQERSVYGNTKRLDRSLFCPVNLHVWRRRNEHTRLLRILEAGGRGRVCRCPFICHQPDASSLWLRSCPTGAGQYFSHLASQSRYFHLVDRPHSRDSPTHGGDSFCSVRTHSQEVGQG